MIFVCKFVEKYIQEKPFVSPNEEPVTILRAE